MAGAARVSGERVRCVSVVPLPLALRFNGYRAYTATEGLPAARRCGPVALGSLPEHPGKAERETRRDQTRAAPGQAGRVPRARLPATADERGWEQRALVGTKRLAQRIRQSDRGAVAQRVLRDLHPETPFPDPCQRLWKGQRG